MACEVDTPLVAEPGRSGEHSMLPMRKSSVGRDRLQTTQSGLHISHLLSELTDALGRDHATGNSRRNARYQRPYRPR